MENGLCWKKPEAPYLWPNRLCLFKLHPEIQNMIFSSKAQVNHFKLKSKFKELRRWRNLLQSICPKHSGANFRERDRNHQKEMLWFKHHASQSYPKKTQTNKKKPPTKQKTRGTWTGQRVEDETRGCESRVLAGHNQDKTFPDSFISSLEADEGLFKGTRMVLSKVFQKIYV